MKSYWQQVGNRLTNYNFILIVFILLSIVAGLQSYYGDLKPLVKGGLPYTQYNNFLIFKYSFFNLIEAKDLYILRPDEVGDLYKYSPTFALLFAPLAILPNLVGVILWNALNSLVLFFAIKSVPQLKNNHKAYMLWFVIIELMTSIQNDQSNGLIAGLLIFAFVFLERNKYALATLFIVLTIYIKIFGVVAFALFLIYPRKGKFILYSALWVTLFAILPLIVVSLEQLQFLYESWGKLLAADHGKANGFSVMGWLNTWFGIEINKNLLVLIGATIFMLPFIWYRNYKNYIHRILTLSSILIWVIIFNHKAESPSFIIAMAGISLWFFSQETTLTNKILVIVAFIFTSLSTTDVFPSFIRHGYLYPYVVKAVPSIIIWFKIIYDLSLNKSLKINVTSS